MSASKHLSSLVMLVTSKILLCFADLSLYLTIASVNEVLGCRLYILCPLGANLLTHLYFSHSKYCFD